MKILQKYVLPPIIGFATGAAATWLSLILFENRFRLAPEGVKDIFENDALSLTLMLTLSSFLLYTVMLLCRKLNGRLLNDPQEERSVRYAALYLTGAALAAACEMLLAMAFDWSFAATLILLCYMIISDLIVAIAYGLLMLLVKWLLKLLGKDGALLYRLRWQIPLSLLWFAAVFTGLIFF